MIAAVAVNATDTQTLYLKISSDWKYPSKYAIHYFDNSSNGWSDFMTEVENENDIYTATIPSDYSKIIFVRFNSTKESTGNWDDKWSQTVDLTLEDGKDLFTITSGGTGNECKGTWSLFEPTPAPFVCDWENISWVDGSNNKLKVCKEGEVPTVVNVQNPDWADESGIYMTFPGTEFGDISLSESAYAIQGTGMIIYLSALDLEHNEIKVNCQSTDYEFTIYNADGAETVYNVAGEPETVFGSTWDTYANKMTLEEGIYKLEKTGLELAEGTIAFKVVKNHAYAEGAWPNNNYELNIAESGIYTISITFNESTKEINATATKTGEAVVLPEIRLHSNFADKENWATSDAFEVAGDKKSASLTMTLAKGIYEFGVKKNGAWTANGVAFTRENPSAVVASGSGNLTLKADLAGEYTFTWTFETNTLSITYPIFYADYATGHEGKADFADANGRILLTLSKSGNDIVVTVKNNNAAGNPQTGLNYLWVNATGATGTATYGSHDTENTEEVSVTVKFNAAQETYVFNNIHWAYAGFGGEWAIDNLTVKASELCQLEKGWYLVGNFNGEDKWDVEDLTADKKFAVNPENAEEFVVAANLKTGDRFKAVYVYRDEIQADSWKPSDNDGYVVTDLTAGAKDIFFRVNYYNTWGGHFYIAPNEVTYHDFEIDLRNGQLGTEGSNMQKYLAIDGETYNYSDAAPSAYNAILKAGSFNNVEDPSHGYIRLVATIPVEVGSYRITLGTCQYGTGTGSVTNEAGDVTLKSFNQNTGACYHQNTAENIVSVVVNFDAAQTIKVVCGQYTPYIKVEKITKYNVKFAKTEGEGILPAAQEVTIGEKLTLPVNQTLYKDGYTLVGWYDGATTYLPGTQFTPTEDVTLTAVFAENAANLLTATSIVTVKWFFGTSNNAPALNLQGAQGGTGFIIAQATIGEIKVDVKLAIDATSGKCSNAGRADEWAQVNAGTTFSFPSKKGITVAVRAYNDPTGSTLDGNDTYTWAGNVATFSSESTAGTSVLVDGANTYYSYLEVTYPASSATALDNNAVEGKTTKTIVNGQLLITRDGKTYNVLGTMVK